MKRQIKQNVYLKMPIERIREDALQGVSLARQAWRQRDPAGAGRALGPVVESTEVAHNQNEVEQ